MMNRRNFITVVLPVAAGIVAAPGIILARDPEKDGKFVVDENYCNKHFKGGRRASLANGEQLKNEYRALESGDPAPNDIYKHEKLISGVARYPDRKKGKWVEKDAIIDVVYAVHGNPNDLSGEDAVSEVKNATQNRALRDFYMYLRGVEEGWKFEDFMQAKFDFKGDHYALAEELGIDLGKLKYCGFDWITETRPRFYNGTELTARVFPTSGKGSSLYREARGMMPHCNGY